MPAGSEPESIPQLERALLFAVDQLNSQFEADPALVARFWDQIAAATGPGRADLTVFHCSVRWRDQTLTVLEFVAGETLEELVKRCEPAALLKEIPLFCRLLDAFEGAGRKATVEAAASPDLELIDFHISGVTAPGVAKLHGVALAGPGGTWDERFSGDNGAGRSRVRVRLKEFILSLRSEAVPGDYGATGPERVVGQMRGFSIGDRGGDGRPGSGAPLRSGRIPGETRGSR